MPYWRGKSILHLAVRWVMLTAAIQFAFYAHPLFANPYGADVVGGSVQMQNIGNTLTIQQATDRAVINWQGFSIGSSEATHFVQPSASSAVLNRVTSRESSAIMGSLQANGQVYLINPNGIMFGSGAVVNVGSFIATTANVGTDSFMKGGAMDFVGAGEAGIVNQGTIRANSGNVILMAKTVKNEGVIQSPGGIVGLLAGKDFYLKKDEPGAVGVRIGAMGLGVENGVENSGMIEAMKAQLEAQGNVYGLAINQSGIIRATGASRDANGTIVLSAPGGMIRNTGTMLALNRDGSGGRLTISGKDIFLSDLSILTAAGSGESAVAQGGMMEISAERDAILNGRLDVTAGSKAKGGRLVVTGERVGVVAGTLDASGGTGGGEILLGGDYQGKNSEVRNASATVLMPEATIRADATVNGDGGKVILWSDDYTGFYGNIFARGGTEGGNGGFVETSSKINLQAFGSGDVGSTLGLAGNWLLDPADVTITAATTSDMSNAGPNPGGGGTTPTGNIFYPTAGATTAQLSAATVSGLLGSGNVAVTTDNNAAGNGDITLSGGVTIGWSSGNTLRLRADRDLILTGTISGGSGGTLELFSNSGGTANQTGGVISVGSLLLNNISSAGGVSLMNGANVVDTIAASSLAGVVSFRDTGGFNGSTGLVIGSVTAGDVSGYTSATASSSSIASTTANGIISSGTVNLTSVGPVTQTQPIAMSNGDLCVVTVNAIGQNILLTDPKNAVRTISMQTLNAAGSAPVAAYIRFVEQSGFAIGQTASMGFVDAVGLQPLLAGAIRTLRPGESIPSPGAGGTVVLTGGASSDSVRPNVIQSRAATPGVTPAITDGAIIASNLGLLGDANFVLNTATGAGGLGGASANNVTTLAANLLLAADLTYLDEDGLQVAFVDFNPSGTRTGVNDVFIAGIRLPGDGTGDTRLTGVLNLATSAGVEFDGIQLSATGLVFTPESTAQGIVFRSVSAANQYSLLSSFTSEVSPGHIEASGNVFLQVQNGDGAGGVTEDNRFTLQEGIHLFAGMNSGLTGFENNGNVSILADNMLIGQNTRPDLTQHGLIMTGSVNNATTVPFNTGVFLAPYSTSITAPGTTGRQVYLISPKADYAVTPDPGQLQLSLGELQRINANRLNVSSAYTDTVNPAVEVRTEMSLYGLYDTTTVSGIFPNNPGVNQIELMATGGDAGAGARGDVTISAPVNSSANNLPMGIFLSASRNVDFFSVDPAVLADNQTSGGTVNVNAGLTSFGGQIGLQGQNVNIGATINANNPALTTQPQNGLVAIFPGRGPNAANSPPNTLAAPLVTPILLGRKGEADDLGILRSELALISAGTVQIGNMEVRPTVLTPINPYTLTSITGIDPLWYGAIQVADAGPITVTDLIAGLSFNTLALVTSGDPLFPLNNALSQSAQAGIQVDGLFVVGNPTATTQDYILGGAYNEINRLAVALADNGVITGSFTGAPTGDLLLVNQGGILGGNGGEVAKLGTRWDQGYARTTTTPVINTGIGLVTARALSIDAKGQVAIYETVPTGATFEGTAVTGLGYIGHVASNQAYPATGSASFNVGNEIGLLGDDTSGLAIRANQTLPGASNEKNTVWVAAARGLSVNDLSAEFNGEGGLAGILTNGGDVTLEGNAIEIATSVVRGVGGNTITIDTTGATGDSSFTQLAPAGARVIIRPATGQNGFLDQPGSSAFDPDLENSPQSGAPVEMALGQSSSALGLSFMDAGWGTIYLGASSLAGTAIRASTLEMGRKTPASIASGKTTINANIGGTGNLLSPLLQEMRLNAGGSLEDQNLIIGLSPFTVAMNLNGSSASPNGNGGLAVDALGAVAIQADVSEIAVSAGTSDSIRLINPTGTLVIGSVDALSGIRGGVVYLSSGGGITQSLGNLITATSGGVSLQASGPIRLDQANSFNLVAANAPGNPIYLRSVGAMSVSSFGPGNPGNPPTGASGLTGSTITLVTGGNISQSDLATITATSSFLAAVPNGADVLLNGSDNNYGATPGTPIIGAYSGTFGTGVPVIGQVDDLTVNASQSLVLGSGGVILANIDNQGSGYQTKPSVTVGSPGGTGVTADVDAIMGVDNSGRTTATSTGSGYQSAPLVTLTDTGGTGSGAQARAVLYNVGPTDPNYGKVEYLEITDPGTGYTGPVSVSLTGGGFATAASFGNLKLTLQQLNMVNPGNGYTATPSITISGGSPTTAATARPPLVAGTGGYLNGTSISGGITGSLVASTGSSVGATISLSNESAIGVTKNTTLTALGGISLASAANALNGTITVGAEGLVTIYNSLPSLLGGFSGVTGGVAVLTNPLDGDLVLASKGAIYQDYTATLNIDGDAAFYATSSGTPSTAAANVVNIGNPNNTLDGKVYAVGTTVTIRANSNVTWKDWLPTPASFASLGDLLAEATPTGTINLVADTGNVIQETVLVYDTVNATAKVGDIILDNIANDFNTANLTSAGDATIYDSTSLSLGTTTSIGGDLGVTSNGDLSLGAGTIGGALNATSNDGAITQATGSSDKLTVTLTSTINAGAGTITLTQANNDFTGAVTLNSTASSPAGFAVQIADLNNLSLGAPTLGANTGLSAVAGQTLTLPAALINTGSGNLTLTSNGGVLATAGNLETTSGSISLTGSTGITIGNNVTTTASLGNLALTSINNAITQTAGLSIFGSTTVSAGTGAITLTQTGNDFQGVVNLTGGTTQITDANGLTLGILNIGALTAISTGALNLGTGTVSGVLSATSNGGAITQGTGVNDALTVTGISTINAGAGTITLTQTENDFQNTVTLTGGTTVSIQDENNLILGTPILQPNTTFSAVAGQTLTLPAALINTGSGNLTLTSNGGVLATAGNLVTTSGSISLTGSTGITIGNNVTTTASLGNLALTSINNAITQTAGLSIFGSTTVSAGTGAITLTQTGNDFQGVVNLTGGTTLITDSNGLTLGTLNTGSLTAISTGALNLGTGTISGILSATSNGGAITQGTGVSDALTVTGISTINAGAGTITLTQTENDFQNTVTLTGGTTVSIQDENNLILGTPILQPNTTFSAVAGQTLTLPAASINTGSGNLTLTSNGGVLATAGNLVTTSGSISLTGSTGITIGNNVTTTASLGNLALTSINNAITQTAGLSIFGSTTVSAGTGAITLTQTGNDFQGVVNLTGGTTQITDANGLTLGTLSTGALTVIANASLPGTPGTLNLGTGTISGVLSATSNGGAITQGTGVSDALTVTGISTINAGAGTITLTQANNDFTGAVSLTGGTTQITDANGLTLGTLNTGALTATSTGALNLGTGTVAGTLVATSNGGAITQGTGVSDALTVTGISTIDAGVGTITLTQTGNDFQNTVTLNSTASSPAGYAVRIVDANNLSLGYPSSWGVNTGVSAVAGGTLTLPVGDIITGAGNINFASDGGSLATAGIITTTSGSISLAGSTGITIGNNVTTTASLGNLALTTANSAVNQTAGTVSIFGTTTVNTGTGAITLTQTGNDFQGVVNLTGGTTQITDANGLTLGTLNTGALTVIANASLPGTPGTLNLGTGTISGNLQANSNNGPITQSGALSVAGTTTLTAGTGSITLNNSSNTFGDTVSVVSANNVEIQASGILQTGSINASGSITIGGTQGVYLSGDVTSQGSSIVYTSAVQLNGPVVMTSNGGAITFKSTLNGNQNLSMSAGSGAILFEGSVGGITPLAVVTIGSASTVTAMQAFNANSLRLQNGAVTSSALFSGLLNLQSLSIGTGNYNVNIAQSPNSIGGETIFNNTGTVTLGSSGAVNFVGGVVATAPSQVILLGNVRAQGTGVINLGTAVQVSGTSVTVGGASTGDITLGSTTLDYGVTLTVGTGIANAITIGSVNGTAGGSASNLAINTTAGATVGDIGTGIGSFTTSAGTLTAQNITTSGATSLSGGSISTGAVNAATLTASGTSVILGGAVTTSGATSLSGGSISTGAVNAATLTASGTGVTLGGAVTTSGATSLSGSSVSTGAVNAESVTVTKTGSLILGGNITSSGAITLTMDNLTLPSPYQIESTGGGTISFAPTTAGRSIWLGSGGPVTGELNLGSVVSQTVTSGSVVVGKTGLGGSGAITVAGNIDASANGFSSLSLRSQNSDLNFALQSGKLVLPSAVAVDFRLGTGSIKGSSSAISISASGGSVQFVSAGGVTLGTAVSQLLESTLSQGLVLINDGSLQVSGTQRVSSSSDLLVETTSGSITLNSGALFSGRNLTIAAAQNFYNYAGSDPFGNSTSGRTLVYSSDTQNNYPTSVTAGLSGFSSVFRVSQDFLYGTAGTYTVANADQIPAGDSMVYSGNPVIPDLTSDTGLVNGFVNDASYITSVPIQGYTLPTVYTGAIRMSFDGKYAKDASKANSALSQKSDDLRNLDMQNGNAEPVSKEKSRGLDLAPVPSPGRLKVGELPKQSGEGNSVQSSTRSGGNFRPVEVGKLELRMSGDFLPFELSEVTIRSGKVSKDR